MTGAGPRTVWILFGNVLWDLQASPETAAHTENSFRLVTKVVRHHREHSSQP
ncbi:hypothetical protein ABBQ38_004715 [Trebouxia sp. C0009 RCD-2024]